MALTSTKSKQHIAIGIIELVCAVPAIICGAITISKLSSPGYVTIGVWALYVSTFE